MGKITKHTNDRRKIVAFERNATYVFDSMTDAALAYNVSRNKIRIRIENGNVLDDGYTTVDFLYTEDDVK